VLVGRLKTKTFKLRGERKAKKYNQESINCNLENRKYEIESINKKIKSTK